MERVNAKRHWRGEKELYSEISFEPGNCTTAIKGQWQQFFGNIPFFVKWNIKYTYTAYLYSATVCSTFSKKNVLFYKS